MSSSSSTPTPTSSASTKLSTSTSSAHLPPVIDSDSTTTTLAESSATPIKKRKRRRKRRMKESSLDANNTSIEMLSPVATGTDHATMNTTTTTCENASSEDAQIIAEEDGDHSSMPPFAVRHNLIVASHTRKRRKRRRSSRRTSIDAPTIIASSSSSTTTTTRTTTTTTSTSTSVASTFDKQSNIDSGGDSIAILPEKIATVIETNEVSSSSQKRRRTKANRSVVGSGSHTANRNKSRSSTRGGGGKDGECLRRIKREWKDAVKMGIAYDWMNMRTINNQRSSSTSISSDDNNNEQHDDTNHQNNYIRIGPYGKNLLRWHFSVAGPANSVYAQGIYHGAILLPRDYPASPPRVRLLTPSGRFIVDVDICLTASNYHPESWTPRWTVVSLVQALRVHMLTSPAEIGGVHASEEKRMEYAMESREWCSRDGVVDHGRMVAMGMFPAPLQDIDGLSTPVVEIDVSDKEYDFYAASQIHKHDNGDEQIEQHEEEEEVFENVMLRQSSSSSLGTNDVDIITTSCFSENEVATAVRINTKTSSIQNVQLDRQFQSHEIVRRSKASKSATTTAITTTQSSAQFESKRRMKKAISTSHVIEKSSKTSITIKEQQRGILVIVLKRIILEMVKLPLLVLHIVLQVIGALLGLI
ncbi:hypothetical protein ACHAWU_008671 [Discostella pseudostelligera]|uniref:UBC core domain-containing protein n=1 Tax=Discostella pseudostelligera TaxID=259834 RepID=A0ABD3M623_9STRA